MSVTTLELTTRDPIVARDGRPFGAGQGNGMRSLSWPLPSVVAGSFRTALVKANPGLDFTKETPVKLLPVEVAGAFPCTGEQLYLPAPNDCLWDGEAVYAVKPMNLDDGGCDFPASALRPVMLSEGDSKADFKPKSVPAWWPVSKLTDWLLGHPVTFNEEFLNSAIPETRDHVCLDADTGAAAEGQIFSTAGLNVTHLSRFGVPWSRPIHERLAEIKLSARVTIAEKAFEHVENLNSWHPLGGERRLVHWQRSDQIELSACPDTIRTTLESAMHIRMVLASPAIFDHGWCPSWLDADSLVGKPLGDGPTLKLVGVCIPRWRAVSGWAYAPHAEDNGRRRIVPHDRPGPKAIRRMVPSGGVYFFEKVDGDARVLATNGWLKPVSGAPHDCRDGFGLAVWGTW